MKAYRGDLYTRVVEIEVVEEEDKDETINIVINCLGLNVDSLILTYYYSEINILDGFNIQTVF